MRCLVLLIVLIWLTLSSMAQPFTGAYLMACHSCDSNCNNPQNHIIRLVQSNDLRSWQVVANLPSMTGSVPDILTRDSTCYIYSPGMVRRFSLRTHRWSSMQIDIRDSQGSPVRFVDPSAIEDSAGRIVLFFLNSTLIPTGQDPAGCSPYPCTKIFDSAVEVAGSDGTRFVTQSGHRLELSINDGVGADPDIFTDGHRYLMYVSRGQGTVVYESTSLHGSYTPASPLSQSLFAQGSVACGIYDTAQAVYRTFVHTQQNGHTVIRTLEHKGFDTLLTANRFATVIDAALLGLSPTTNVESPSICRNTLRRDTLPPHTASLPRWKPFFTLQPSEGTHFTIDSTSIVSGGGVPRLHILEDSSVVLGFSSQLNYAALKVHGSGGSYTPIPEMNIRGDGGYIYLPDGRVRYVTEEPTSSNTQQRHKSHIVSYLSDDGLTWQREPGVRYTPGDDDDSISSVPSVIQLADSVWRMYYVGDFYRTNGARTALTHDWGKTWIKESPSNILRIDDVDPQPVYLTNGSYRLYMRVGMRSPDKGGIGYCDSPDGLHFDTTQIVMLMPDTAFPKAAKLDPSVIRFPDGRIGCYFGAISIDGSGNQARLLAAWADAPSSVESESYAVHAKFVVTPNPVSDVLHYHINGLHATRITFRDIVGRHIETHSISTTEGSIDCHHLHPGTYILTATDGIIDVHTTVTIP